MKAVDGATEFVSEPSPGRVFSARRKVRLGDVTPKGRLRLDAVARYLQDVANDDATDAALPGAMFWVVRRTVIDVQRPLVLHENAELRTFCGGVGSRWAERRTRLIGDRGGLIETVSVWVSIDAESARPARLGPEFVELYGEAAGGREVRARSLLSLDAPSDAVVSPWPQRSVDLDVVGHVNNAVYWAPVEEELRRRCRGGVVTAELEFRAGIPEGADVELVVAEATGADEPDGDGFRLWIRADGVEQAAARVLYAEGAADGSG